MTAKGRLTSCFRGSIMTANAITGVNFMSTDKTTIQLTRQTAARLSKLGHRGDTYEIIILRLLEKKIKSAS